MLANARMLGMNERQLLRHVYWPSALTWMFSSLHTSVGFALVGAVVGEYLGSAAGLGYLIHEAEGVFDVTGVFAGMLDAGGLRDPDRLAVVTRDREPAAGLAAAASHGDDADATRTRSRPANANRETTNGTPYIADRDRQPLALAAGAAAGRPARRRAGEAKLTLGVGGKPLLYYLPLTIAERKGFFKEQGLDVEINDFGGGAKSLQALIGGSVDVVTGAYEHTIRMQAKGQDIARRHRARPLSRRSSIAVRKDKAGEVKSAADFKGMKIGVTAPGSSTDAHRAIRDGQGGAEAAATPSIIGVGARRQRGRGDAEGRDRRHLATSIR